MTRNNGTSSTYTYETDSDLATLTHAFASGSTPGSATWGFTSDASAKVTGITISADDIAGRCENWLPNAP